MDNIQTEAAPIAPLKMGKFAASKQIVKESWNVLKQDKEILYFPVISSALAFLFFIILGIAYYLATDKAARIDDKDAASQVVRYAFIFVYYIGTFFIANFFQACILIIASGRFNNRDLTFHDGLAGANKHIGKIFIWSLISATVGFILQVISDKLRIAGRIIAFFLGAAWNILTYFSLPALIIGDVSIKDSFRESARVIRKTWGETIIVSLGMGLFFGFIILASMLAGVVLVIIYPTAVTAWIVFGAWVIWMVIISMLASALGVIYKLALYEYARTGVVPNGFSPELIQNTIKAK